MLHDAIEHEARVEILMDRAYPGLLGTATKVEYPAIAAAFSDDDASIIDQGVIMTFRKARLIAAAAAIAMGAAGDASALGYDDILGNWCSATARLEFSRDTMGVFVFANKSRVNRKISTYEFSNTTVTVRWYLDGNLTSSSFGEFNGSTMFLQPGGDVPRREYHRC